MHSDLNLNSITGENLLEINFNVNSPYTIIPNQSYIAGINTGTNEMIKQISPRNAQNYSTRTLGLGNRASIEVPTDAENIQVRIFDVSGKMYSNQMLEKGRNEIEIPANLSLGLYFVQIFDGFTYHTKRMMLP